MKKIFSILAMVFIISFVGCKKTTVSVTEPVAEPDDESPVAVQFGLSHPVFDVVTKTKSLGGIDAWNNNTVYVLGYLSSTTDFALSNAFIPNVAAEATGNGTSDDLEVLNHDIPIYDQNDPPAVIGYEPYYYAGSNIYDFYGYYVDDAYEAYASAANNGTPPADTTPQPIVVAATGNQTDGTELTPGVYIPFIINGSQDIMNAATDKAADVAAAGTGVATTRCYSAYSARRNVVPTLNFEHRLARFTFEIQSGSLAGNDVIVESISVKSKAKGYLRVIGEGEGITVAADDTELTDFNLMQRAAAGDACEALQETSFLDGNKYVNAETDVTPQPIGESILVIPGEATYTLTLKTKMSNSNTEIADQTFTLSAEKIVQDPTATQTPTVFEAGKSYKITIIIYGLEDVAITAALEEWVPGGDITIDPDEDFENENPIPDTDTSTDTSTGTTTGGQS